MEIATIAITANASGNFDLLGGASGIRLGTKSKNFQSELVTGGPN
jgi:hypothetical protein